MVKLSNSLCSSMPRIQEAALVGPPTSLQKWTITWLNPRFYHQRGADDALHSSAFNSQHLLSAFSCLWHSSGKMWSVTTESHLQVDFYPNWQFSSSCYGQTDALLGDCKPLESTVAQDDVCRGSLTGKMIFMGCCEVATQQEGEIFQSRRMSWLQSWDDARAR